MHKLKKQQNPFTMVPNELAQDTRLSLKAKGIYLYLNSKPADWQFYNKLVCNENNIGVDAWRAGVNELIDCGWILKTQSISKSGTYGGNVYELVYTPNNTLEDIKSEQKLNDTQRKKPCTENPSTDKPCTENTDTTNKDITNKDLTNKEYIYKGTTNYMDLAMVGHTDCENVKISQEDYDKLLARFGSTLLAQLVEQLDSYLVDHPRKYKSHAKALRSWAIKQKQSSAGVVKKRYESVQEHNKRMEQALGLTKEGVLDVLQ